MKNGLIVMVGLFASVAWLVGSVAVGQIVRKRTQNEGAGFLTFAAGFCILAGLFAVIFSH